jgi:hypothetical protein
MKALLDDEERITLGDGAEYTIAALSLDEVIEAESLFADIGSGKVAEARNASVTILGFALRRRHPEVTADRIGRELLNLRNMTTVMTAVFRVSGMLSAGEAQAGQG